MVSQRKMFASVLLLGAVVLAFPALTYASDHHDGDRHYYRYHDRPSFGIRLSFVPQDAFIVHVGDGRYYYYDGLYYVRMGGEYVLVSPPLGAVVSGIPSDYRPVVINGVTYYRDNGIYYMYTRYGYRVVPPPVMYVTAAPEPVPVVIARSAPVPVISQVTTVMSSAPAPVAVQGESFTVNIPDNKGGYTAVVIKRSGSGFVGPQGEYYPEFPKVTQLQAMYVK